MTNSDKVLAVIGSDCPSPLVLVNSVSVCVSTAKTLMSCSTIFEAVARRSVPPVLRNTSTSTRSPGKIRLLEPEAESTRTCATR